MVEFEKWFREDGDRTRLLGHNLSDESIVFEVGGYLGNFTNNLFNKFNCRIYVFEPVRDFYEKLCDRFKNNEKITIFNYGLANKNAEIYMKVDGDNGENSTILEREIIQNSKNEKVILKRIDDVMEENNIKCVDLLNINIEGGEFDLLNYLITTPVIYQIENIQVQFHDFVKNAETKRNIIHTKLYNTHRITYNYDFVWENWRLRYR